MIFVVCIHPVDRVEDVVVVRPDYARIAPLARAGGAVVRCKGACLSANTLSCSLTIVSSQSLGPPRR